MAPLFITAAVSLTIGAYFCIEVGRYVRRKFRAADDTIARITTPAAVSGLPYDEDEETR